MQKTSILHSESIFLSITLFSYNLRKKLQFLQFFFLEARSVKTLQKILRLTKLQVEELSQLNTSTQIK